MKFYFSYFKLRFITSLQYRASALAGIITQIFFGLIFIMVYMAFYESNSSGYPMQINELISYLWLNQIFFSLINMFYKDREIFDLIKTGNIAYELARPKKIYFMWFSKIIGQRLADVLLRCLPVILFAFILPEPFNLSLPSSFLNFVLFLITLFIGTLLMTSIITLFHIIALLTLSEKGITNLFVSIADILSGGTVPIPFFPLFMQKIANILPFRYVSDLSFRIYSANVSVVETLDGIIIQLLWFIILLVLGNIILNSSMKKVVVQGG